jgi:NitT/TauT family transport system permease protein
MVARFALLFTLLALWQFLPEVRWIRSIAPAFDPFFISSPAAVAVKVVDLAIGRGAPLVWPFLGFTLWSMFVGGSLGIVIGVGSGLLLSNDARLRQVLSPFIAALAATPRVALVPIFIIIFGPTMASSVATAVLVVFFTVFFNAFVGGSSLPREVMQNARLMGATKLDMMLKLRLRYVMVWTFAALPNAISFALISVITAEILSGSGGMGRLIVQSLAWSDSTVTFALVLLLSVIGASFVSIAARIKRRALHWWPGGSD